MSEARQSMKQPVWLALGVVVALVAALLATVALAPPVEAQVSGAIVDDAGCSANTLAPNDDASTAAVPIGFEVDFLGQQYTELWINNNGNVTFDGPLGTYTPFPLLNTDRVIIAPYFGDVDTRATGGEVPEEEFPEEEFPGEEFPGEEFPGEEFPGEEFPGEGFPEEEFPGEEFPEGEPPLELAFALAQPIAGDGPGSAIPGVVNYGTITFGDRTALCVRWAGVGYYSFGTDLTNDFQLLLVERGDIGAGDFDIIFNYNQLQWEAGTASEGVGGLGGSSARAGYASAGLDAFELDGSAINGALLDTNPATGLIYSSLNSSTLGRYVFPVRNGEATGVTVSGTASTIAGEAVANAPVQLCLPLGGCITTRTNTNGEYQLGPVPDGEYSLRISAPAGSNLNSAFVDSVVVANEDLTIDLPMTGPIGLPSNATFGTAAVGSVPRISWSSPTPASAMGCVGGTATYSFVVDGIEIASGALVEGPPGLGGIYAATVPAVRPNAGIGEFTITVVCPDGSTEVTFFTVYIDPSGNVVDQLGNPLLGATVTLLRSDSATGPFAVVPDGSDVMSPANRTNPDLTNVDGGFAWFTTAGFYIVRAELAGCTDPADPASTSVETPVLEVPPERLGLILTLECPVPATPTPTPATPTPIPTAVPTATPIPTATPTEVPVLPTPIPTATEVPVVPTTMPTATAAPVVPTSTAVPTPTAVPVVPTVLETVTPMATVTPMPTVMPTVIPPGSGVLGLGTAVAGLSGDVGSTIAFTVEVPEGADSLTVTMAGDGDADLYVRAGQTPTAADFDCRPYLDQTSNERCVLANPVSGTWFVLVDGYRSFNNVSILAEIVTSDVLANGASVEGLAGEPGTSQFFTLEVPAGATNLRVDIAGGGDADLYLLAGADVGLDKFDCRPYLDLTSDESCVIDKPISGVWSVMVFGYRQFSGVTLRVSWDMSNQLQVGVPSPVLSGSANDEFPFTFEVAPGTAELVVTMTGEGDADLYVRFGGAPTPHDWDCRPYVDGTSDEHCVVTNPTPGTWWATARGWSSFSDTTITVN